MKTKHIYSHKSFGVTVELIGGERKNFAEGRWTPYMSKGKLYGVDSSLCACGFYYQPEVFKKVGLEKFPETWDDLMTAGKQAAKDGVALSAMDGEASSIFYLLYLQRGGTAFDKDGNFVLKDSPNKDMAIEVLNFLKEGVDNKVIYAATNADFWGQGLMAAYGQGKVAGVPGADWYSDFILKANAKDMSGKWRLAKLPKWKSGGHSASVWGGTGFAITKASKNPQLAWDLLHYSYMTKENQIKRFEEIKYSPHMLDAINDPRVTDVKDPYFGDQQTGKVWAEVAGDLPFLYQSPVRGDMEKALGTAVTNVVAGKAKAEDALNEVISITQKAIQDL